MNEPFESEFIDTPFPEITDEVLDSIKFIETSEELAHICKSLEGAIIHHVDLEGGEYKYWTREFITLCLSLPSGDSAILSVEGDLDAPPGFIRVGYASIKPIEKS